jgi:hypothetical protein
MNHVKKIVREIIPHGIVKLHEKKAELERVRVSEAALESTSHS